MVLAWPGPLRAQTANALDVYLRAELGFSSRDLSDLARGRVVTRILDAADDREIAVASAARLEVGREEFLEEATDIAAFLHGRTVTRAEYIGDPPRESDFLDLSLPSDDLEELAQCRPGDCRVKLPTRAMTELAALDWHTGFPRQAANDRIRRMFADFADSFREGRPLPAYADKREPVGVRDAFRSIATRQPYLLRYVPLLRARALEFPGGPELDAVSRLLWTEERFGLKPVLSLTHALIHEPGRAGSVDVLVLLEQLYASHYFEGSFSLITYQEDHEGGGGMLLYIRHHRFDDRLSAPQRRLIQRQIRTYVDDLVAERAARFEGTSPG